MALKLFRTKTQFRGPVTVGFDDTGYDVKFHGATSGASVMWDESGDEFLWGGNARFYKDVFIAPSEWDVTSTSASVGQFNSMFRCINFDPTAAASQNVDIYAWRPAPDDIDTSASLTAYVYWSGTVAAASQAAEFTVAASYYGDGEAEAGTAASVDHAKYVNSASDANTIEHSSISGIAPPAAGDLMGLHFQYQAAGSSTTGSDFQFHGLKLRYVANKLGTTL